MAEGRTGEEIPFDNGMSHSQYICVNGILIMGCPIASIFVSMGYPIVSIFVSMGCPTANIFT